MWLYSAANNGFYNTQDKELYVNVGSWPDDLVELTDEDYQALCNSLSSGDTLKSDYCGRPMAFTPEPTMEEIQASVDASVLSLLSTASMKIAPLQDAVDLGIATTAEAALLTAWKTYRVAVNRVPTQSGYPTTIDWPAMPT